MNATKNDVFCRGISRFLAEHERVAEEIRMHDDTVPLVVVAENQQIVSKLLFQVLNMVGNSLFFHRQRGVHEVNGTHREANAHGSHVSQAFTLFE